MSEILITKANGQTEPFDILKLEHSLRNAHASDDTVEKVSKHILSELRSGMTTEEIYSKAFSFLHTVQKPTAMRYSLKRAVMDLGPSGFPFEQLIARIFKEQGYSVETDKIVNGKCAEHEVDIIAHNDKKLIMIEAKFHNSIGLNSDLKVALYIKARFDDLKQNKFTYGHERPLDEGWLITNTKFTTSAIKYAECQNLTLVGWNFPLSRSLHHMIESAGLHPITSLTTLSQTQKQFLVSKNIIICSDIEHNKNVLHELGLTPEDIDAVDKEIDLLYKS
jgi:hypothetical protein